MTCCTRTPIGALLTGVLCLLVTVTAHAATLTWNGEGTTENASDDDNWVGDTAPAGADTDEIILDGTSGGNPDKDMTWDLTRVVGSWTQSVDYAGEVTINCLYAGNQEFAVDDAGGASGDLHINGGSWTHSANSSTEANRLKVSVDGDLVLGAGGTIDAVGLGYVNAGPSGSRGFNYFSCHGGRSHVGLKTYGSLHSPTNIGASQGNGSPGGGGAICLTVTGNSDIDGTINADGGIPGGRCTSGGSAWLTTATLTGNGTISANADGSAYGAGGGRVSVVLTGGSSFDNVSMTAYGFGDNSSRYGGAGTVYTETSGGANRTVKVDNNNRVGNPGITETPERTTPIPPTDMPGGSTWTVDKIIVCNSGILEVVSSSVLNLTANAITNNCTGKGWIRLNGGTFILPASVTLQEDTGLIVDGENTVTGNVTLASGSEMTHSKNLNSTTETYKMNLNIVGNLTVDSGAVVSADQKGYASKKGPGSPSSSYGASYGGHGLNSSVTYGSILAPVNLGSGNDNSNGRAGGAIRLTVTGSTTLNGPMTADARNGDRTGSGGSVYLTTGTLGGSGDIHADGADFSGRNAGGGRVAVVVSGGDFSGYSGSIHAYGGNLGSTIGAQGTVYKSSSSSDQLVIDNGGDVPAGTRAANIPPNFAGNATYPAASFVFDESLAEVDVIVHDSGRADFGDEVTIMASLTVTNSGYLVLSDGLTHSVGALTIDGSNFVPGATYSVAQMQAAEVDSDISGTGFINVGSPLIENDPATNISLTGAYMNGELTAKGVGSPDVKVFWGTTDGAGTENTWENTNDFGEVSSVGPLTANVSVNSNLVYFYRYRATNNVGQSWATPTEVFLPGTVWIVGTDTNASEQTGDNGTCTVYRASSATNGALTVNYTVSGSATPGSDYQALSGVVTIEVNQASADIVIDPIFNGNQSNEHVVVTMAAGSYLVGTPSTATVLIEPAIIPEGYNVWLGSDPLSAASWSSNRLPIAADNILLGAFSQSDLTWSASLPSSVNMWTQQVEHTGEVTFETVYASGGFNEFTVTGDTYILGGSWKHKANSSTETYYLRVSVGGNLVVGASGTIDAIGLGHTGSSGPAGSYGFSYYSSHGGRGYAGLKTYGSLHSPTNIGATSGSGKGGGAIRIDVSGGSTVDGTIAANGTGSGRTGAGGSVWLTTGTLSGGGTLSADGGGTTSYGAGGGRVSVVLTSGSTFGNVSMTAYGFGASATLIGGPGTVYTETSGGANRTVTVDNNSQSIAEDIEQERTAPIPPTDMPGGSSWTVDRIVVRNNGVLEVPATADLTLTANAITNSGTDAGSIRLNGGVFIPPAAVTFPTNTVLIVDGENTVTSDVTLAAGAMATHSKNLSSTTETYKMDLRIVGNFTLESGASVDVYRKGYHSGYGPGANASYGASYGGHGTPNTVTYGSLKAPHNLGSATSSGEAGGAIKINVSGSTTLNGTMSANAQGGNHQGSGGSIFLTTGTLSGIGSAEAKGGMYSGRNAGGGRVSVVVTGGDFSSFSGSLAAPGGDLGTLPGAQGTVYKSSTSSDQLVIDNSGNDTGSRAADIPPSFAGNGSYPASEFVFSNDLSEVVLIVTNKGTLNLTTNVWVRDVLMYSDVKVTLGVHTLYVRNIEHNLEDLSDFTTGFTNQVDDYSHIVWVGFSGPGMVLKFY